MRRHILQHHNGIVHHVTNSDRETRQGNHVERTACCIQVDERGNQRHRDGDDNNGCRTPSTQEDEHHQCHKQHGVGNRLFEGADRVQDVF